MFRKRTPSGTHGKIRIPDFEIESTADAYVYYVDIMHLSEELFWNAEIYMLDRIVNNKQAYQGWLSGQREKLRKG